MEKRIHAKNRIRLSPGDRVFNFVNICIMVVLALIMFLPFLHVVAKSFSADAYVISGQVGLWPRGFNFVAYRFAFSDTPIVTAFKNTLFVTIAGTALSVIVTAAAAYPLSLVNLKGRKLFIYYFIFTMLFSGGLVPGFVLMNNLNLLNNLWSLILPHILSVYNMILIKTYFEGIPDAIRESAMMDGANNIVIFSRIMLPMAKPIIATIVLFSAVSFWNSYYNSMLYLSDPDLQTLQLFLVNIVKQANATDSINTEMVVPTDTIRAATVVIGTVPILIVYPFLQKYFVTGITLGSVKG